eukprot:2675716-Prymnesium_polylepis.2
MLTSLRKLCAIICLPGLGCGKRDVCTVVGPCNKGSRHCAPVVILREVGWRGHVEDARNRSTTLIEAKQRLDLAPHTCPLPQLDGDAITFQNRPTHFWELGAPHNRGATANGSNAQEENRAEHNDCQTEHVIAIVTFRVQPDK